MALNNIKFLAKKLAALYRAEESALLDFSKKMEDVCLSSDDSKELSILKSAVDAELTLVSVALSAAAQNKLKDVKKEVEQPLQVFVQSLTRVLEEASKEGAPPETQQLVGLYSHKVHQLAPAKEVLATIEFYKDLPRKKSKQRKVIIDIIQKEGAKKECSKVEKAQVTFKLLQEMLLLLKNPFVEIEKALCSLMSYVNQDHSIVKSTKGDLDE